MYSMTRRSTPNPSPELSTHGVGPWAGEVPSDARFVARILARHLIFEALRLILCVVQLGKSVGQLTPADEELPAIRDERILVIAPRQR